MSVKMESWGLWDGLDWRRWRNKDVQELLPGLVPVLERVHSVNAPSLV